MTYQMDQDTIDANQVAFNTPRERHSEGCPRRKRPDGELFIPGKSADLCNCWVIDASLSFYNKKDES